MGNRDQTTIMAWLLRLSRSSACERFAVNKIERLGMFDWRITTEDGKQFIGFSTIWVESPSGRKVPLASRLSENLERAWQRHRLVEKGYVNP